MAKVESEESIFVEIDKKKFEVTDINKNKRLNKAPKEPHPTVLQKYGDIFEELGIRRVM